MGRDMGRLDRGDGYWANRVDQDTDGAELSGWIVHGGVAQGGESFGELDGGDRFAEGPASPHLKGSDQVDRRPLRFGIGWDAPHIGPVTQARYQHDVGCPEPSHCR